MSTDAASAPQRAFARILGPQPLRAVAGIFVLLAAVAIAYIPVYGAGHIWDDYGAFVGNPLLRTVEGLRRIWFDPASAPLDGHWYPMVFTTFWIEWQLGGGSLVPTHVGNVVLHAANALLGWALLARLRVPGAWFAAAAWALHPLNVESVAWIYERKNTLSMLFALLAAFAWLRFDDTGSPKAWAATFAAFVFALLSKTYCATLPATFLALSWWRHGRIDRRRLLAVAPFVALAIALGAMDSHFVGRRGSFDYGITAPQHILLAGRTAAFYVQKLIWPSGLMAIYPKWTLDVASPVQWLFPAAFVAVAILAFVFRARIGRGPIAAAIHIVATMFPVLGFAEYNYFGSSYVADHLVYHASLAALALCTAGVLLAARRFAVPSALLGVGAAAVLAACTAASFRHARLFKDSETLFGANLVLNPEAFKAHLSIAAVLDERGDLEGAERHFREGLRIEPRYARTWGALASIAARTGRVEEARELYARALELDPNDAGILTGKANLLADEGRLDESIALYTRVRELRPGMPEVLFNLGVSLHESGRHAEALDVLRERRRLEGPTTLGSVVEGLATAALGNADEASALFAEAVRLDPEIPNLLYNQAKSHETRGQRRRAATAYREALAVRPDHLPALNNLAWLLATSPEDDLRDGAEAVLFATRATQLAGKDVAALLDTLAAAHAEAGDFAQAVAIAERALALAEADGNERLASGVRARLEGYRSGKPHRAASP